MAASYRGVLSCCICFGAKDEDWAALCCGHVFHAPCVAEWIRSKKPAACPMCRSRTKAPRTLVGIESQIDAADEAAVSAHLQERESELSELMRRCQRQALEAAQRADEAVHRAAAVESALNAAERRAQSQEHSAAKAQVKLADALRR